MAANTPEKEAETPSPFPFEATLLPDGRVQIIAPYGYADYLLKLQQEEYVRDAGKHMAGAGMKGIGWRERTKYAKAYAYMVEELQKLRDALFVADYRYKEAQKAAAPEK